MRRSLIALPDQLDVDLAGLSAAAEPWMARLDVPDQRIQTAPDARNIRYYQTAGLLDRPERYDGRTARYGVRHLLQLIAIRVMQARGLSLAQVQASLSGSTNLDLQQVITSALGLKSTDSPPLPTPTALVAAELAPGVVVTIDSRVHPDIARTLNVLRRALAASDTSHGVHQGDLS